jgi:hypothetical protein
VEHEDVHGFPEERALGVPRLAVAAAVSDGGFVGVVAEEKQLDEDAFALGSVLGVEATVDRVIETKAHRRAYNGPR